MSAPNAPRKEFGYYHNLRRVVTHALLHLLSQVAHSQRFVPVSRRNDILIKYLKPKLTDKALTNVRKDIKLMIFTARDKRGNLERKLYELNNQANQTVLAGAEKLYNLLVYLQDQHGIESQLYDEASNTEKGVLYMLQDHIEHCFDSDKQVAPLSVLLQDEQAPALLATIEAHGWFTAEMKEWNSTTHQAHILLHPRR